MRYVSADFWRNKRMIMQVHLYQPLWLWQWYSLYESAECGHWYLKSKDVSRCGSISHARCTLHMANRNMHEVGIYSAFTVFFCCGSPPWNALSRCSSSFTVADFCIHVLLLTIEKQCSYFLPKRLATTVIRLIIAASRTSAFVNENAGAWHQPSANIFEYGKPALACMPRSKNSFSNWL